MGSSAQIPAIPSGPEVGNWQRFLTREGFTDFEGKPLHDDEVFGRRSAAATSAFQAAHNLETTGVIDALTRRTAIPLGFIPFVQAKRCTILWPRTRVINCITIHTIECSETSDAAEANAAYFSSDRSPKASAHYFVDTDSVVQTVRDSDIAWHANQVNDWAIGIEHAGTARQNEEQWRDAPSSSILWRSAQLAARLCRRYGIPVVRVTAEELADKPGLVRGLFGHVDVTRAYRIEGGHTDPGPAFPWDWYLDLVRMAL